MPMPILLQPLKQWSWTRLPWPLAGAVFIRSSRDSRAHQQRSQDALGLFSCRPKTYVAVVADGVSQSFFGDFAAWVITEHLIAALCHWPTNHPFTDPHAWNIWGQQLRQQIAPRYALLRPQGDLTPILQRVLEEKHRLGSEAMFAAARLDFPSDAHPQGRIRIIQGGNIRVRLWGPDGLYEAPLDEYRRWSTRQGFTTEPWLAELPLQTTKGTWLWNGLLIYTDGAPSLDTKQPPWPLSWAQQTLNDDWRSPLSDDQTYLEVRWANEIAASSTLPPWPSASSTSRAAPQVDVKGSTLHWTAASTEWLYARVEAQGRAERLIWTTPDTELTLPPTMAQARVQLVDVQGQTGPWSSWQRLQAAPQQITNLQRHNRGETIVLMLWSFFLIIYFTLLLLKGYNFNF